MAGKGGKKVLFTADEIEAALKEFARKKGDECDDLIIRLLYAVRDFDLTGDKTALLQLPLEERQLLEPLLQPPKEKDESAKK
jgi:hypothetical protein